MSLMSLQHQMAMPAGALSESASRLDTPMSSQSVLTSGTLRLGGLQVLPKGKTISVLRIGGGSTAAVTPTNQWMCLVRFSDRAVIVKTADETTRAWGVSVNPVFTLTAPYTPTEYELVWLGVLVVAATVPTVVGWSVNQTVLGEAPVLCGNSTAGLTTPASLTGPVTAPSVSPLSYYCWTT